MTEFGPTLISAPGYHLFFYNIVAVWVQTKLKSDPTSCGLNTALVSGMCEGG